MLTDYHMHTTLCRHAVGEPEEYVQQAIKVGLDEICFTDHIPTPDGVGASVRMVEAEYGDYRDMVLGLRKKFRRPEILMGIEAEYYPGCEEYLPAWLERDPFDIVLGSVHYMHGWGLDDEREMDVWRAVDIPGAWQEYFGLIARMAESRMYDVASHLDVAKKFRYVPPEDSIPGIVEKALDSIAASGMAIEINTSGLRKPVGEMYPSPAILGMMRARNIPICFGSDAHAPEQVGMNFDKAVAAAKAAGYTHYVRFRRRKQIPTPLP